MFKKPSKLPARLSLSCVTSRTQTEITNNITLYYHLFVTFQKHFFNNIGKHVKTIIALVNTKSIQIGSKVFK